MKISWEIKSFIGCFCTWVISTVAMLGLCGGLMWFVDFSLDAFLAGVILGAIFGFGIFFIGLVYTVHSFIMIFKKK